MVEDEVEKHQRLAFRFALAIALRIALVSTLRRKQLVIVMYEVNGVEMASAPLCWECGRTSGLRTQGLFRTNAEVLWFLGPFDQRMQSHQRPRIRREALLSSNRETDGAKDSISWL